MIVEPARWIERFAAAGADTITVHVEAHPNLYRTLRSIEEAGATPSVTLNPGTPVVMLEPVLPIVRQVLIMSVNPGFGGQTFIPASLGRIRRVRELLDAANPTLPSRGGRRHQDRQRRQSGRGRRRYARRRLRRSTRRISTSPQPMRALRARSSGREEDPW